MPEPKAAKLVAPNAASASRILVVDDEDGVTLVMGRQLALHGYDVMTARDGREALAMIEAGPMPALVITDVIMPGDLQGHQLAGRIHELWPEVLVLLMSGYQSNSLREKFTYAGEIAFLQKPISQLMLLSMVAKLLAQDPQR